MEYEAHHKFDGNIEQTILNVYADPSKEVTEFIKHNFYFIIFQGSMALIGIITLIGNAIFYQEIFDEGYDTLIKTIDKEEARLML